jgi:DNA polymerase-1
MIGNPIPSLWDFYRDHAQPAMLALARAGNQGVWVDREMRTRLTAETEAELSATQAQLKSLTGLDLNPNSPKQVSEYLYDNLHLAMPYDRQARKYTRSTKEQVLEDLAIKYPTHKDLLYLILDYRGKQKLIGTFLTNELDSRGKLVTSYHATGTVGGRISSSTTIFGEGGNMQQFPRGTLRRMIVAPPGRCFIKVDLSQAEARVVAWIARDLELINNFQDPTFDVHRWNAAPTTTAERTQQLKSPVFPTPKLSSDSSDSGLSVLFSNAGGLKSMLLLTATQQRTSLDMQWAGGGGCERRSVVRGLC